VDDRAFAPLVKARALVDALAPELVEKTMWGSPAGKKRLAKRLAAMLPAHKAYTEPFAGSAAVLFAKPEVATEAINDADPEIASAYKLVQKLSDSDLAKLREMDWTGSAETFKRLKGESPTGDVAKLYRFLYLTHFAYGKMRGKSFSPSSAGIEASTPTRVAKFAPRLKNVQVFSGDYEPVVRKFDGKDSLHFLDPPYTGYNVAVGEKGFDEERFFKLVKGLQGKFLITYGIRGKLPKLLKNEGYPIKRIRTPRTIRTMQGVGGPQFLTQIIASNYELSKKRVDDLALDGWELVEEEANANRVFSAPDCRSASPAISAGVSAPETPVLGPDPEDLLATPDDPAAASTETSTEEAFAKTIPLIKGLDPSDERYVLGIVLEPETVDAQEDIYSAAEIRSAAHRFMEEFQDVGLMHKMRVNGAVKIVESYLAPGDLTIGDRLIKKGTWLLGVRVFSDALWLEVKEGHLTGFSIGGSARRQAVAPQANPEAA
jgi:DNA adenine methylase